MRKRLARQKLLAEALSLVSSEMYAEMHPEDPTTDWDAEYREESFDTAVKEYNQVPGNS